MIKRGKIKKIKTKNSFIHVWLKRIFSYDYKNNPDWTFLGLGIVILIIGLIILTSASSVVGLEDRGDSYYFLKQQLIQGLPIGIVLAIFFYKVSLDFLKKYSFYFFVASLLLLVLVLLPYFGDARLGASRWLNIAGFSFQPSELAKFAFIIYLASWLSKQRESIKSFRKTFLPFIFLLLIVAMLIILQPDMGTMGIFMIVAWVMLFAAGGNLIHLFSLILAGVIGVFVLIKIAPYRAARLTTFLDPSIDPQGIGYHINQALLAIGSGGIFGRGLGHSRQKFLYLPEVYGDSIFAVLAEELGFLVSVPILGLFIYFFIRGLNIAKKSPNTFSRLLVVGIITWWASQSLINIGAMVGIFPLTGVPLPFVSYGSTALAVNLAAFGLVLNISRCFGYNK